MRELALQAAAVLAILVAIAHGAIGELRVFAKARIEPQWARSQHNRLDRHWTLADRRKLLGSQAARQSSPCLLPCMGTLPSATRWSRAGGTSDGA